MRVGFRGCRKGSIRLCLCFQLGLWRVDDVVYYTVSLPICETEKKGGEYADEKSRASSSGGFIFYSPLAPSTLRTLSIRQWRFYRDCWPVTPRSIHQRSLRPSPILHSRYPSLLLTNLSCDLILPRRRRTYPSNETTPSTPSSPRPQFHHVRHRINAHNRLCSSRPSQKIYTFEVLMGFGFGMIFSKTTMLIRFHADYREYDISLSICVVAKLMGVILNSISTRANVPSPRFRRVTSVSQAPQSCSINASFLT
jgi:hypothetical protein